MGIFRVSMVVIAFVAIVIGVWDFNRKSGPPKYKNASDRPASPFRRQVTLPTTKPLQNGEARSCLVTGASGFLGGTLVERLLEEGWQVRALHRNSSDLTVLSLLLQHFPKTLTLVEGDVTDIDSLRRAIPENLPVVFHVAAVMQMWFGDNEAMYDANVLGTRNLVDVCLEQNVGRLIHTSTVGVYSSIGVRSASAASIITEHSPKFAADAFLGYTNTKYLAELEVLGGIKDGLWATMLNPAAIIGKYDVTGFARVAIMLKEDRLPGVTPAVSSCVHSRAVADAHIAAVSKGKLGENYLLGGHPHSLSEIVQVAGEFIGKDGNLSVLPPIVLHAIGTAYDVISLFTGKRPDITAEIANMMTTTRADIVSTKAQQELGFNNSLPMRDQLKETVEWLKLLNKV